MITYIALLRGINVGGHKKTPMAELRELLTTLGFEAVKTYIQSGNVVFQSNETDTSKLEDVISKAIVSHFKFDVPVLVKTRAELQTVFEESPFKGLEKEQSYFVMLSKTPNADLVEEANQKTYPNEQFYIIKNCIYFYCENGYGRAKFNLSFFEKKLEVNATARNYKTMVKLLELSE